MSWILFYGLRWACGQEISHPQAEKECFSSTDTNNNKKKNKATSTKRKRCINIWPIIKKVAIHFKSRHPYNSSHFCISFHAIMLEVWVDCGEKRRSCYSPYPFPHGYVFLPHFSLHLFFFGPSNGWSESIQTHLLGANALSRIGCVQLGRVLFSSRLAISIVSLSFLVSSLSLSFSLSFRLFLIFLWPTNSGFERSSDIEER